MTMSLAALRPHARATVLHLSHVSSGLLVLYHSCPGQPRSPQMLFPFSVPHHALSTQKYCHAQKKPGEKDTEVASQRGLKITEPSRGASCKLLSLLLHWDVSPPKSHHKCFSNTIYSTAETTPTREAAGHCCSGLIHIRC